MKLDQQRINSHHFRVLALLLITAWTILPEGVSAQTVSVYQTTSDGSLKLTKVNDRSFHAASCGGEVISISATTTYQTMDGFGAAMTGSAAYLINTEMTETQRNDLMNDLFGASGINLSFIRHSIGASDFSLSDYTYHDPGNTFSIDVDRADVIPMLQQAKSINSSLKIMGTPWTAPAWMKTNNSMKGGSLTDDHLDDFALYLVRYMEAFEDEGLPIYAITMQNEPLNETTAYPSMRMEWFQQSNLLRYHLGPLMSTRGLTTKVLLYDHNWDETDYAKDILSIPETAQYAAGTAFHGYAGGVEAQSTVYNHATDKGIWFTEQSGGGWSPDFDENLDWYARNLIMGSIKNWSKSIILWNLALDTSDGPQNGGCTNCRGVVTVNDDGSYTKEIEYYVLGHLSKFVLPDAIRIYSSDTDKVQSVAFKNPDDRMVLIAYNTAETNSFVRVNTNDQEFDYTIPAGALVTFTWEP
ncbi:MAG: glycoside hydrolase family 30 beta sandwich domain-containing protein [Bacteroidota bacterium]